MKLLTVVIPCYNAEAYMENAIKSALKGKEKIEIIIVDDGSNDNTLKIAKQYENEYPNIVRAIHQSNGGHGEAVNTGIKNANGLYFKVLDSDDLLEEEALIKVLNLLEEMTYKNLYIDMLVTNFLYDKQGVRHKKMMSYKTAMPKDRIFGWDDLHFKTTQYLLMHSVIYKTDVLLKCGLKLPKHVFYVDNIYVFQPLPYIETMYYMDICLYRYYIGRKDQSVNESVMIKRLDQQYLITKTMLKIYNEAPIRHKNADEAMVHYFGMMMCVSSILSIMEGSEKRLKEKEELWMWLKKENPLLHKRVRYSALGRVMNIPGRIGRNCSVAGYRFVDKIVGFN